MRLYGYTVVIIRVLGLGVPSRGPSYCPLIPAGDRSKVHKDSVRPQLFCGVKALGLQDLGG